MTNKIALILVDIQNDYFMGGRWPLHDMDRAATHAARLLSHARDTQRMVVHVRHEGASTAPFFRAGTKGAEIHQSVAPIADEPIILKHRPNSFHETNLLGLLHEAGITRLQIAGAMAQMCIDATTRAAKDYGFDVEIVAEACAAKAIDWNGINVPAPIVHAAFMGALAHTYATIATDIEAVV